MCKKFLFFCNFLKCLDIITRNDNIIIITYDKATNKKQPPPLRNTDWLALHSILIYFLMMIMKPDDDNDDQMTNQPMYS